MNKFSSEVFTTSLFGEPMAVLCGAEGNKLLFTNENKLVNVWFPRSINKLIPKASTMRYLGGSFLKPETLQSYIGIMDVTARRHLETSWDKNKEVMVFPLVKNYTFSLACKLFLGMDDPDQFNNFSHIFRTLFLGLVSIPVDLPGTRFHRAIKASSLIRNVMHEIIKQRKIDLAEQKASPTQDILSHLLTTSDENGVFMNETDIGSRILGLLIGGYDTTTASITSIVKYLAEHPHVYDQVLKEQMKITELKGSGEMLNWDDIQKMKYSWNVACETMRLTPTTLGSFREAITDFTYAGFLIPKGMKLFWSSYTTHRNPDNFPNPEKFNPSRFEGNGSAPYTYVPFGGGPRMCPGKEYSRLIILVFMHNLVKKYRWEKSIPDEKIIYDPLPTPAKGLPVRLQHHDMH